MSNWIFTACVACKNQFWTWFLQVKNPVSNMIFQTWFFKNQVQMNRAYVVHRLYISFFIPYIDILLKITFFLRLDNLFSVLIVCLYFQTRGEGCLYLERARDNYQNYDFESRLTVRIHSALRYYSLINEDKIN